MTSHQIMVSFDFDDESISRHIEQDLYNDVLRKYEERSERYLRTVTNGYNGRTYESTEAGERLMRKAVDQWIADNESRLVDIVTDKVARIVANTVMRRKANKEKVDAKVQEALGD